MLTNLTLLVADIDCPPSIAACTINALGFSLVFLVATLESSSDTKAIRVVRSIR
jgi:hypothetical protein